MPQMGPSREWKAISTKSPVENSCCNCSNPPVMEMDRIFACARWPPSAITAAATDPWSCTRGDRWLAWDWGKWVIADGTMPRPDRLRQITKALVHGRMLNDGAKKLLPAGQVCDNNGSNFPACARPGTLVG